MNFEDDKQADTADAQDARFERLGTLSNLVAALQEADAQAASAEAELKRIEDLQAMLSERTIPDLMTELGLESVTLKDGTKLKINKGLRASFIAETKPQGLEWLRDTDNGGIIRNNVSVSFGVGEDPKAQLLKSELDERGMIVSHKEDVPWNTLSALIKEIREAGKEVPETLFSVHEWSKTKITQPKGL